MRTKVTFSRKNELGPEDDVNGRIYFIGNREDDDDAGEIYLDGKRFGETVNRKYVQTTDTVQGNMGYLVLKKNQDFKTQVEDVSKNNTIFEIRYDYDLEGQTVTIPAGCTLKFEGGKLANGTLASNDIVFVDAAPNAFIFDNIETAEKTTETVSTKAPGESEAQDYSATYFTYLCTFGCDCYADWFGAKCQDDYTEHTDSTAAIQAALNSSFATIKFNRGYYYVTDTLEIRRQLNVQLNGTESQMITPYRRQTYQSPDLFGLKGTVLFTDKNIDVFDIQLSFKYSTTERIGFSIKGGCIDVSQVDGIHNTAYGTNIRYSKSVIHMHTGLYCSSYMDIDTALYGPNRNPEYPYHSGSDDISVLCDHDPANGKYGYGVRVSSDGQNTMNDGGWVKGKIMRFHTAVVHDDRNMPKGWPFITNIRYDLYIDGCPYAYNFGNQGNHLGVVNGSIQAVEYFVPNNEECLFNGDLGELKINAYVWDIMNAPDLVNNRAMPAYVFDAGSYSHRNMPYYDVQTMGAQYKSIKNIGAYLKHIGYFNTRDIARRRELEFPYVHLIDNVLYKYREAFKTSSDDTTGVIVEMDNGSSAVPSDAFTEYNKNQMFTTFGAIYHYIEGVTTVTITLQHLKDNVHYLDQLFIGYKNGSASNTTEANPAFVFQDVNVKYYDEGESDPWYEEDFHCMDGVANNPNVIKPYPCLNTDKIVITLSNPNGTYRNSTNEVGDGYSNLYIPISIEGSSTSSNNQGIDHLTRTGFKISDRNIALTDYNLQVRQKATNGSWLEYRPLLSGTFASKPSPGSLKVGSVYWCTDTQSFIFDRGNDGASASSAGNAWVDHNGNPAGTAKKGSTFPSNVLVGTQFLLETSSGNVSFVKPMWYAGNDNWVDANGNIKDANVFITYVETTTRAYLLSPIDRYLRVDPDTIDTVVGITIIESGKVLTIALNSTTKKWYTQGSIAGGGTTTGVRSEAMADMAGKANTAAQVTAMSSGTTADAPIYCNDYSVLNDESDKGKWWLPSFGELLMIYAHKDEINYALSLIEDTDPIDETYHWSSTEGSNSQAWYFSLNSGRSGNVNKESEHCVRPVTVL